ncbi:MAG: Xaa-Pro peptidase family protein [Candidatus Bathyarchaeota archaeon]|nr:Xaa-Pro peptidase family protein [Candidatus Bathyarchaeota archaeon]
MVQLAISQSEYEQRIENLTKILVKKKLDALYLTNGTSFFYLTGYSYITTERPAALVIPVDGEITFMGPLLEIDHIPLKTRLIKNIKTYPDYPGEKHPIDHFAAFLRDLGFDRKRIGIDNPAGAAGIWGYTGPPIKKKLPQTKFVDAKDVVPNMRLVKSTEEIELMKESAKWANLAHTLLQEYVSPGLWDVDIALTASYEASMIMKKTLGPDYEPLRAFRPVGAGFRGQVGSMSAIPHSMSTKRVMMEGDVLVTGAGADVGGYSCELERTMIMGKPTEKQRKYFGVMVEAQKAAMEAFAPGKKCSEVDKASIRIIRKMGYGTLLKHHTGHGLGLEGHEPPWLDVGDDTVMKPGMVFSCEPGIYESGFGGFRHSDTVVITEDGAEVITYYPRDIDSLTIL